MATADDAISGIDLPDDRYTVVQSLIRNKYEAMDEGGDVVLRGEQKLLKIKEAPFTDADGSHVGSVDGQFSVRDRYEDEIDDAGDVPMEAVVAAAMVIDAIEGN